MRLREFSRIAFGEKLWASVCDLDRKVDATLMGAISLKTAIPSSCLFRSTLRSYEGSLIEKLTKSGSGKWLLPIGVNRDYGERFGFQFCPECLSGDKDPYYRRHWRLAFVTACARHCRLLLDRCPHCRSPVNPVRSEVSLPYDRLDDTLIGCFRCGQDLRESEGKLRASRRFLIAQNSLVRLAEGGCGRVFGMEFHYAHLFFDVLFRILQLLLSPKTGMLGKAFREISQITFTVEPIPGKNRFRFLLMGVRERHETLDAGFWIMSNWPRNFLKVCRVGCVPSACLTLKFKEVPFWFWKVVKGELVWDSYQTSPEEVESAIRYLEKSGLPVNIREIVQLVGGGIKGVRKILQQEGYRRADVIPQDPRRWRKEEFPPT